MKLASLIFLTFFMQGATPDPKPMTFNSPPISINTYKYEGPTVEINAYKDGNIIAIKDKNRQPMVIISKDGKVTYGKDYKPDEGARTFWEVLARAYPEVCRAETKKP